MTPAMDIKTIAHTGNEEPYVYLYTLIMPSAPSITIESLSHYKNFVPPNGTPVGTGIKSN